MLLQNPGQERSGDLKPMDRDFIIRSGNDELRNLRKNPGALDLHEKGNMWQQFEDSRVLFEPNKIHS